MCSYTHGVGQNRQQALPVGSYSLEGLAGREGREALGGTGWLQGSSPHPVSLPSSLVHTMCRCPLLLLLLLTPTDIMRRSTARCSQEPPQVVVATGYMRQAIITWNDLHWRGKCISYII